MDKPTPAEISARVKEALAKQLQIPLEKIKDESLIVAELGLDSFGMIELMFELEDATGIKIPDGQMPAIQTVQDLANFIHGTIVGGTAGTTVK